MLRTYSQSKITNLNSPRGLTSRTPLHVTFAGKRDYKQRRASIERPVGIRRQQIFLTQFSSTGSGAYGYWTLLARGSQLLPATEQLLR